MRDSGFREPRRVWGMEGVMDGGAGDRGICVWAAGSTSPSSRAPPPSDSGRDTLSEPSRGQCRVASPDTRTIHFMGEPSTCLLKYLFLASLMASSSTGNSDMIQKAVAHPAFCHVPIAWGTDLLPHPVPSTASPPEDSHPTAPPERLFSPIRATRSSSCSLSPAFLPLP